jgi:hypothetical protein
MNRKKKRIPDAVTIDMWATAESEKKEVKLYGPCEICGKQTIIDLCPKGMPTSMTLCSADCASKYIELYDRVLEPAEEIMDTLPVIFDSEPLPVSSEDESPMFSLPIEDDFDDELPVFENPWHKGFVEKEGEVSRERYELVTQSMHNKYIGAYLILHPELKVDEMETRIDSHYVVWIDKRHNAFCEERGIKRKEGYSSHDTIAFHEFLYRPINQALGSC